MESPLLLRMENIRKNYGQVEALKGVDLALERGEILGLVGDNAAGKSTLIKILSGAVPLTSGTIFIDEKPIQIDGPADSRRLGIETVYQQFALVDNLPIYCNVFLGRMATRKRFGFLPLLDKERMQRETHDVLKKMSIRFDSVKRVVAQLSGGQRQSVAIARAISFNPRILILDEPTSGLAVKEVQKIEEIVVNFKEKGISVILISHRLESIFNTADRIMVLRAGVKVMDERKDRITSKDVVEKMFGLEPKPGQTVPAAGPPP
jgi:simple sugar transport system ATP-binding protein